MKRDDVEEVLNKTKYIKEFGIYILGSKVIIFYDTFYYNILTNRYYKKGWSFFAFTKIEELEKFVNKINNRSLYLVKDEIIRLYNEGQSPYDISKSLQKHRGHVCNIINRYRDGKKG